jgi:hypothetical protein
MNEEEVTAKAKKAKKKGVTAKAKRARTGRCLSLFDFCAFAVKFSLLYGGCYDQS